MHRHISRIDIEVTQYQDYFTGFYRGNGFVADGFNGIAQ